MRRSVAAALVAALAVAGCARDRIGSASSKPEELVVARATLVDFAVLTGELDAADSAELKVPRTSTWQLSVRWLAPNGSDVKQGDRLVEFDNSAISQRLNELELAIIRAENDLVSQRARDEVTVADKELEVERQRVEVGKAEIDASVPEDLISRRTHQQNELALSRSRVAHATAVDELEAARRAARLEQEVKQIEYDKAVHNYQEVQRELDALVLTAPRDGVLVIADHPWFGRPLQVGDMVRPGFSAAKVSSLAKMQVVAQLSDVDDGRIAVGMPASAVLDAYPDRVFPGRVEAIEEIARSPSEKSIRRFFAVTIALEATDTAVMRPGMSARVDVEVRTATDALVAPRGGLQLTDAEGGPRARASRAGGDDVDVEVGFCTARACTIEGGLAEGDRLRRAEGWR